LKQAVEGQRLGKYEVRTRVGRGEMGTIYEAWDPTIARKVAIKMLPLHDQDSQDAALRCRFRSEAQAAGRLSDPNIVSIYDYGETEEFAYIVMDYIEGGSLDTRLVPGQALPLDEVAVIMAGLLAGLQHSHEHGVVHRDIKPSNIILTCGGRIKITDFGIAHLDSSSLTQTGTIIGTPAYMSPEQITGERIDQRTDLYSAGVVLYRMLTGRRPFEGSTVSIMNHIVNTPPPRPSQAGTTAVPAGLEAMVVKALAKRPEQRFQSAAEFAKALHAELGRAEARVPGPHRAKPNLVDAAIPDGSAERPVTRQTGPVLSGRTRIRTSAWLSAGVAAMLAAGTAWWLLHPPGWFETAHQDHAAQLRSASTPLLPVVAAPVAVLAGDSAAKATPTLLAPAGGPAVSDLAPPTLPAKAALLPPLQDRVDAILAAVPCTLLRGRTDASAVDISGVAGGHDDEGRVRRALAKAAPGVEMIWRVRGLDGVPCAVLDALRPAARTAGTPGEQVTLVLAGRPARLLEGDRIVLQLALADFPALYWIDDFRPDGSVVHMVSTWVNATRSVLMGQPLTLSGAGGRQHWVADAPFGTDLIAVVVASAPLFSIERPGREAAGPYMADLRAAIERGRANGVRLAVDAVPVEIARRPLADTYGPASGLHPSVPTHPRVIRAPPTAAPEAARTEPTAVVPPVEPPPTVPSIVQQPAVRQPSVAQRFLGQSTADAPLASPALPDLGKQVGTPPAPAARAVPDADAGSSGWTVRTFGRQPGNSMPKAE